MDPKNPFSRDQTKSAEINHFELLLSRPKIDEVV